MEQKVFFEENGLKIRPKQMTPTELLGIESIIETRDAKRAQYMYDTIFEHLEVEIAGVWVCLKEEGANLYNPATLADEVGTLYRIATAFLTKVLMPLFRKSGESKK